MIWKRVAVQREGKKLWMKSEKKSFHNDEVKRITSFTKGFSCYLCAFVSLSSPAYLSWVSCVLKIYFRRVHIFFNEVSMFFFASSSVVCACVCVQKGDKFQCYDKHAKHSAFTLQALNLTPTLTQFRFLLLFSWFSLAFARGSKLCAS